MVDLKHGGYRPPPPVSTPADLPVVPKPRPFDDQIPGTAGDVDPNLTLHNAIARRKARADFRRGGEDFRRLILQHGKRVRWRKAMLCPCLNETSGQADLSCTECDGSGYLYVDPLDIQAHMAAFEKSTKLYEKFGLWVAGETSVTVEPEYRLGWRDSIEMIDDLMNFNELLRKGNRKGRRSILPPNEDVARYRIAHMTRVLVRDGAGNIVPLEQSYHFRITDDGHIVWLAPGDKLVAAGTIVSVHYDFHPVWVVISHPHVARSDIRGTKVPAEIAIPLPVQAAAQLDFITDSERPLPVTGQI